MSRIRTRFKVLAWAALALAGLLTASVAGPMYASYYWPKELSPSSFMTNGPGDFEAMIRSIEKAKPVAATANMLTSIGRFITAGASVGLAYTLFRHYRNRQRIQRKPADEEPQIKQLVE